jgi:VIT1/CCC1 family predicted Fe2+/Mn2+ transporter/rubrerythrin
MPDNPSFDREKYIKKLLRVWRRENVSRRIYQALAEHETDANKRQILMKLSLTEKTHSERWTRQLQELGAKVPEYHDTLGDLIWRWVLLQSGTENALARIESAEDEDTDIYEDLMEHAPDEADRQEIAAVLHDEQVHQAATAQIASEQGANRPKSGGKSSASIQGQLETILGRERWHKRGGGWIGQAIYGANDGLGSVFGIVSGVAGATAGGPAVLVAGLAGMMASALSMGSGAYLATKSEREVYQAEIGRERRELQEHPEEEAEELSLFYQLKGVPEHEAEALANRLISTPQEALKTLAAEELGLSEQNFPNPWTEALSATLSTAFGAFIPILPFFFTHGYPAVIASFTISTVAHFAIGAAKTVVTGLSPWKSGLEMMLVGLGEALVTYLLGVAFGGVI